MQAGRSIVFVFLVLYELQLKIIVSFSVAINNPPGIFYESAYQEKATGRQIIYFIRYRLYPPPRKGSSKNPQNHLRSRA